MAKFDINKVVVPTAKPLPVILLLDVSGSMRGEKIAALNKSVEEMIASFADQTKREVEIQVSAITFGSEVKVHLPYTPAPDIKWTPLSAGGATPLADALVMAKEMVEDKATTPSRAYRPAVVLVSDGAPWPETQPWEQALAAFVGSGRSSKCERYALGIGSETDESVREKFVEGTDDQTVHHADDASGIVEFFKFVTMSVSTRSKSSNPNQTVVVGQSGLPAAPAATEVPPAPHMSSTSGVPSTGAASAPASKPRRKYW